MIKKRNVIGVNLSEKAIKTLQVLGYLGNDKKSTRDKNLSFFISNLIEDFIVFHPGLNEHDINIRVHLQDMRDLERERSKIEDKMRITATKITQEREILKVQKP